MKLVKPSVQYQKSYIEGLKEYQQEGRFTDLSIDYVRNDFETYVKYLRGRSKGKGLPEGWVSETDLWLVDNDEIVGNLRIRHELTESLLRDGGHIGYDIRPSKRKQGYGSRILELGLKEAKRLGIKRALITCDITNIGSRKIIESNHGKLENKVSMGKGKPKKLRYWIELK